MGLTIADNHPVPFTNERDSDPPFLNLVAGAEILRRAGLIAAKPAPVLIEGETGTGKTVLARWIHQHSPRATGPLVKRGCGEIDTGTGPSALFGHVRGAFTGALAARVGMLEQASGGTLILDDVDYLSLEIQAALLRFLDDGRFTPLGEVQERAADVRIVATSNKDLDKLAASGRFLPDLRARLRQWRLRLTPLRRSPDAIRSLAAYFLQLEAVEGGQALFRQDALDLLISFDWPENIRQLRAVVANAALRVSPRHAVLGIDDILEAIEEVCPELTLTSGSNAMTVEAAAEERGLAALRLTGFNIAKAARILHCSRPTLYRMIERRNWRP